MPQSTITADWVIERLDQIYPVYRAAFGRLMTTLRHDFDGDLDAMLVMLTMSQGTERTGWAKILLEHYEPVPQMRLTNTQSISQASGIPRETVRRKLEALKRKGWVERDAKGNWTPTAAAVADLRNSSRESISFIRAIAAAALLAEPAPASGTRQGN